MFSCIIQFLLNVTIMATKASEEESLSFPLNMELSIFMHGDNSTIYITKDLNISKTCTSSSDKIALSDLQKNFNKDFIGEVKCLFENAIEASDTDMKTFEHDIIHPIHVSALLPHHYDHMDSLSIFGLFYGIFILFWIIFYLKKKELTQSLFKLSPVSKKIYMYMGFKVLVSFTILIYYFAADLKENLVTKNFLYGVTTISTSTHILQSCLLALFSLGYGTLFFRLDAKKHKNVLLYTIITMVLYCLLYFPRVYGEFYAIKHKLYLWSFVAPLSWHIISTAAHIAFIVVLIRNSYKTYHGTNESEKALKSAIVIAASYVLHPFIGVPSLESMSESFGVRQTSPFYDRNTSVPEILELVVMISLIYIWRDLKEENGEAYSGIPLSHVSAL